MRAMIDGHISMVANDAAVTRVSVRTVPPLPVIRCRRLRQNTRSLDRTLQLQFRLDQLLSIWNSRFRPLVSRRN